MGGGQADENKNRLTCLFLSSLRGHAVRTTHTLSLPTTATTSIDTLTTHTRAHNAAAQRAVSPRRPAVVGGRVDRSPPTLPPPASRRHLQSRPACDEGWVWAAPGRVVEAAASRRSRAADA